MVLHPWIQPTTVCTGHICWKKKKIHPQDGGTHEKEDQDSRTKVLFVSLINGIEKLGLKLGGGCNQIGLGLLYKS